MRERLECAVLAVGQDNWAADLCGPYLGGRLVLHALQRSHDSAVSALADTAVTHGRYDAGLIPVDESTISAWRTALAAQAGRLPPLLLVYAVDLRAQAIRDLLTLGVADFVCPPFCPDELRARLERALCRPLPVRVAERSTAYGAGDAADGAVAGRAFVPQAERDLCDTILQRSGAELEAYAVALAMQRATSRESFRAAKGQIVARFERAYIRAALGRHGGNITMAARMAQKHRRAFWALMRKHDIDPAPYRRDADDSEPQSAQAG